MLMQVASCVADLSGISSVVVGVIVDVLDSSVGQVDRVVALPVEDNGDNDGRDLAKSFCQMSSVGK